MSRGLTAPPLAHPANITHGPPSSGLCVFSLSLLFPLFSSLAMFTLARSFLLSFAIFSLAYLLRFKPLSFIAALRPHTRVPVDFGCLCSLKSPEAIYGPFACPFWRLPVLRPVRAFLLALSCHLFSPSRSLSCPCRGVSFPVSVRSPCLLSLSLIPTHTTTTPRGSDQENAENRKKFLTFWGNGFSVFVSLF